MRWILSLIFFSFSAAVLAQDYDKVAEQAAECRQDLTEIGLLGGDKKWKLPPWECQNPVPRTLTEAVQADLDFHGGDHPGYHTGQGGVVCTPLTAVGMACNYGLRGVLTSFVAVYGQTLFPSQYGDWPNDGYHGTAQQNEELARALRRNAPLLADGELTAEEVANNWR